MTGLDPLRLGLIIPSSNRLAEPQFFRHAPPGVAVHFARLRMTGPHHQPLPQLLPHVAEAALTLADTRADLIVFHCTGTAMGEGPSGDQRILATISEATGCPAISTATGVVEALQAVGARRIALALPQGQKTLGEEAAYLEASGFEVVRRHGMGLTRSDEYLEVTPTQWVDYVVEMADPGVDTYFLSCANTHAIDAVEELERRLDRPVVTSNQATLWSALRRLGRDDRTPGLGRLFQVAAQPAFAGASPRR
ncbi:MAG: maleate cis-trans isomerase [Chloroflexi bacterium]|nr:maleate cis-trans isomerase [Chloroflexota bacterium]